MRITDIKVFPVREEKLKAFISIVLDECFMVNDIKVIKGKEGFFISMPSRRKRNGKFKDIAHPLNNVTRQSMEREILTAYDNVLDGAPEERNEVKARPTAGAAAENDAPNVKPVEPPRAEVEDAGSAEPDPSSNAGEERSEPKYQEVIVEAGQEAVSDAAKEREGTEKSLEEVTEQHLRDSFWGT